MAFSASTAFGTTIQIDTGGGFALDDLIDSTSTSLDGAGFAAFGVYGGGAITDLASLVSQFTIGNFDNGSGLGLTTTDIKEFDDFGTKAVGFDTGPFLKSSTSGVTGENIAVAFWKGGSDISTATEAVVFEFTALYETGPTPVSINYLDEAGTLVFGNSKIQTAVLVPEPSSLALLGLGATALLFRRRM